MPTNYTYFPSCNFTAAFPEVSKKLKSYLSTKGVDIGTCCRLTQSKLTPNDNLITICFTCSAITSENNPETHQISIWEYLLSIDFDWPDYHGEEMVLQDCFRARNKPEVYNAVRECLRRMNITIIELEENKDKTMFDGTWLYNPQIESNLKNAPIYFNDIQDNYTNIKTNEEQLNLMKQHVTLYKDKKVVDYCTACHKGILLGGGNAIHILELISKNL